jgi:arylsulfatase A-like enzyme
VKTLTAVFRESVILAIWIGLAFSGWQTALAANSMPHEYSSILRGIHFSLYSLGGFTIMGLALLIPGFIAALFVAIFSRDWDSRSIQRFLLSSAIGTGILITAAATRPIMIWSIIASGGFNIGSMFIAAGLLVLSYLLGTVFSVGAFALLDMLSVTGRWSLLWGWWLFMIAVPPTAIGLAHSSAFQPLGILLFLLPETIIWIFVLWFLLPRTFNWIERRSFLRSVIAVAVLAIIYLVTIPISRDIPPGAPADGENPPVVLITIDTLRADALDCYPEGDILRLGTPNIDRIADEGVVFENAYSSAPWTVPSVGSILSGLPPGAHGAVEMRQSTLSPGATTIAEILSANGYITGGFVVNALLGPSSGMNQGFDIYVEEDLLNRLGRRLLFQRLIDRVRLTWPNLLSQNVNPYMERDAVRRARDFISRHSGEKFFLWLHLFAPHTSWNPPKEYQTRAIEEFGVEIPREVISRQMQYRTGSKTINPSDLQSILALYAGEVAFADDSVGQVIDQLDSSGVLDDSLIIVSADHGEEFYEHDGAEHGHTLYPELVHIPLIIRHPGSIEYGIRIPDRVSLDSLAPTIIDLAGLSPELNDEPAAFFTDGFAALLDNREIDLPPVFFEDPLYFDHALSGVISNDFLYIDGEEAVLHPRLYYLPDDPDTWYDILRDYPRIGDAMSHLLDEYKQRCTEIAEVIGTGDSESIREQLRSLGYLN